MDSRWHPERAVVEAVSDTPPFPTWGSRGPRAIVEILSHQEIALPLGLHPIRCLAVVTVASCQNG